MYGFFQVDFGSASYKNVTLWTCERERPIIEKEGVTYFINTSYTFMETKDFQESGEIVLHGSVWESDEREQTGTNVDDLIANFEGYRIKTRDFFNKNFANTFVEVQDEGYVKLTLMITQY